MVDRELARLQLLKQSIAQVLTQTVAGGNLELKTMNRLNYTSKKNNLKALVDFYIDHLNTVRKSVTATESQAIILSSAGLIAAEIRRWEGLKIKIMALTPNMIDSFKAEMKILLDNMETELVSIQKVIQEEIAVRREAA